jgi:hypothetical protein
MILPALLTRDQLVDLIGGQGPPLKQANEIFAFMELRRTGDA